MRNNIITVKYNEYSGKFTVKPAVYQWDYGLIMQIDGLELPDATEWHFGNGEKTVTAIGDATSVSIPDECLEKTGNLQVYYFGHTGESDGETIYNFTIPVLKRPEPSDVIPTPEQQDVITQTIAVLQTESDKAKTSAIEAKSSAQKAEEAAASINDEMIEKAVSDYLDDHPVTVTEEDPTVPEWAKQANKPTYTAQEVGAVDINELPTVIDTALAQAKASGEFDGEPGPKGDKGDPGEDGYTPQKGVDYFDGAKGDTGSPGADGFSPTASVSKSGNVATITVTDKTGTTSAQVSDGVNGENGSDGEDGITPIVSVTTITGGHNVAFSYGSGDSRNTDFDVLDGSASGCVSQEDFDALEEIILDLESIQPDSIQDGYAYNCRTNTVASTGSAILKKVTIESGKAYYVSTTFKAHSSQFALISYFDSQDQYLSDEYPYDGSNTPLTIENRKLIIPSNAAWFYVNCRYGSSDICVGGNPSMSLTELANIEQEKEISILFIGNSLTQDGIAYLPYVLKTYYPEVKFRLYMWYIPAYDLSQQYTRFVNDEVCNIFSVAENTEAWTNYERSVTMSNVLDTYTFKIVCMQEYFNYKRNYSDVTDWNNCRDYIEANYSGANGLEFVSLFHAPVRDKADEIFDLTKSGNAMILQETIADDILPTGIAVYRALSTALDSLGDQGHLSPDGTHTQEGLPCLLQTYVALLWVFERLGINKSIYGSPMRMTTAIYNTLNVPGANLGTGVITGTDAENLLAQEVAIQAYKECRQFVIQNRLNDTVDDISKLSDFVYTGKITLTKSDFEGGSWSYSSKSSSSSRLRSKALFPVKAGLKIKFTNPSFKIYFGTMLTKDASSYSSPSGWLSAGQTDAEYTIPIDGYTNIILESSDGSSVSVTDYDCTIQIVGRVLQDGITPTVSVTSITGGHNVAFSYGSGDARNTNFDVLDGQDGATGANGSDGSDGITPTTTVTQITGGHNVAFSYGTGDSRNTDFNVMDGAGGSSPVTFGTESGAEGQSNPAVRQVGGAARATAMGAAAFNYGVASGSGAFAEGGGTTASGANAHAEGGGTNATGACSHAEGASTTASGADAHAEGASSKATGDYSHAEGSGSTASGQNSHAEGAGSTASGLNSHAEGTYTTANRKSQHVFGEYNVADDSVAASTARGNYVEIVGNGYYNAKSNARTLDWSGNEKLAGSLTLGMGTNDETTLTASQLASVLANQVVTQTVSGTDVTITGVANTRYICGEVSTISITPPASGIIDVVFSSGSTVAVLTLPQTVKMPYWFEVEANKMYEINIMDGIYGAVMSWT